MRIGSVKAIAVAVLVLSGYSACKSSAERIEEQSKKENVLTNYVKNPQDKAKNVKNQLEAAQNSVAQEAERASQFE